MTPQKILVIYATAGAGHRMAAQAVYEGLQNDPRVCVVLADSLDHTSPFFKKTYSGVYTFLITQAPWLWGFFFCLVDLPVLRPLVRVCRRVYNALNAGPLHRYLVEENFDWIISTHFMANEVAAALKRAGKIQSRILGVVTDYDVHSIWLAQGIECYAVACDWTRDKLMSLGVPGQRVSATGIPTMAKFSQPKNIFDLRAMAGLQDHIFTVLIATGSFGIGPIEEIIHSLKDIQVMVICGHNRGLYERLKHEATDRVKIYGLVNDMDEKMAMADVMITKPGGLSISEALVSGLPMIFFNAIPGQETHNVRVLKIHRIGHGDVPVSRIPNELKRMQADPSVLETEKKNIRAFARPHAVRDIVGLILK